MRQHWKACDEANLMAFGLAPGVKITIARPALPAFRALAAAFRRHDYQIRRHVTGAFNCRTITGGTSLSNHAYGTAVDVNWDTNPYRADGELVTDMPTVLIEEVERIRTIEGVTVWRWGGRYRKAKDAMHFEVMATPAEIAAGIDIPADRDEELNPRTLPVLKRGTRGDAVKLWQQRRHLTVDGIFGKGTELDVRGFQQSRKLDVDGVIGPATWTAMLTGAPAAPKIPPGKGEPLGTPV